MREQVMSPSVARLQRPPDPRWRASAAPPAPALSPPGRVKERRSRRVTSPISTYGDKVMRLKSPCGRKSGCGELEEVRSLHLGRHRRGGHEFRHGLTEVPRSSETTPSWDPTVGLCLGPYGGPRQGGYFLGARYPCKPCVHPTYGSGDLLHHICHSPPSPRQHCA